MTHDADESFPNSGSESESETQQLGASDSQRQKMAASDNVQMRKQWWDDYDMKRMQVKQHMEEWEVDSPERRALNDIINKITIFQKVVSNLKPRKIHIRKETTTHCKQQEMCYVESQSS